MELLERVGERKNLIERFGLGRKHRRIVFRAHKMKRVRR